MQLNLTQSCIPGRPGPPLAVPPSVSRAVVDAEVEASKGSSAFEGGSSAANQTAKLGTVGTSVNSDGIYTYAYT